MMTVERWLLLVRVFYICTYKNDEYGQIQQATYVARYFVTKKTATTL